MINREKYNKEITFIMLCYNFMRKYVFIHMCDLCDAQLLENNTTKEKIPAFALTKRFRDIIGPYNFDIYSFFTPFKTFA